MRGESCDNLLRFLLHCAQAKRYLASPGLVGLIALLLTVSAHAFSFSLPGASNQPQEPPDWPFRPQAGDNARGQPPAYAPGRGPVQPPTYQPGFVPGPPPNYRPGAIPGQPPDSQAGFPPRQAPTYQPGPTSAQPTPGYPRYPGNYPWGPGQQSSPWAGPYRGRTAEPSRRAAASRPPRLELEVAETQPYVMQSLLVRARLISDGNLAKATPEPPNTDLALWKRLAEPRTRLRDTQGRQEVVTEFVLVLTPLRVGDIEVPPLAIVGNHADRFGQSGRAFEVESEPLELQVRPAMSSVNPWLPLTNLALRGSLDRNEQAARDEPVTLILELEATGAAGDSLPSLEPQLRATGLRVYREQTLTNTRLSSNEQRLEGQRTEYYTLIPDTGGRLQLPEIQLAWWNVATGTREVARMPVRTLGASPGSASMAGGRGLSDGGAWLQLALPLAGVLLLLIGYWVGVWYQGRPGTGSDRPSAGIAQRLGNIGRGAGTAAGRAVRWAMRRGDPRPAIGYLRRQMGRALPPGLRLALAVHSADREAAAAAWYERLQALAWPTQAQVKRPTQPTLNRMVNRLSAVRPSADRSRIERLLKELEGALYGGQEIDFPRWKRQFRREFGLASWHKPRGWALLRRAPLPPLNPQPQR